MTPLNGIHGPFVGGVIFSWGSISHATGFSPRLYQPPALSTKSSQTTSTLQCTTFVPQTKHQRQIPSRTRTRRLHQISPPLHHSLLNQPLRRYSARKTRNRYSLRSARYTADGPDQAYTKQAQAYGLDKLLSDLSASQPGELPLLFLPKFSSNLYLTIRNTLKLSPEEMASRFLANLLQTKIRNNKYLALIEDKHGPRLQAYAAVTSKRLPTKPKPKRIAPLQPMLNTQFPCSRCLAAATILTTTDKKYTEKIETKTRNKTVEEYTKQLPESLRTRFLELHATITDGKPNHQESLGCPLPGNAEKRLAFQQVAPNRLPDEQRKKIYPALVNACKLHHLCTRCGRPRTARNEQQHKQCSAYTKKCPHILRNSCKPFKHVRTPSARSPNHMAH